MDYATWLAALYHLGWREPVDTLLHAPRFLWGWAEEVRGRRPVRRLLLPPWMDYRQALVDFRRTNPAYTITDEFFSELPLNLHRYSAWAIDSFQRADEWGRDEPRDDSWPDAGGDGDRLGKTSARLATPDPPSACATGTPEINILPADAEPRTRGKRKKEPPRIAFAAYLLSKEAGLTQESIARRLQEQTGTPLDQSKVCRYIGRVRDWLGDGNPMPPVERITMDPRKLERGPRRDDGRPRE